jgi:hypothetical protein
LINSLAEAGGAEQLQRLLFFRRFGDRGNGRDLAVPRMGGFSFSKVPIREARLIRSESATSTPKSN